MARSNALVLVVCIAVSFAAGLYVRGVEKRVQGRITACEIAHFGTDVEHIQSQLEGLGIENSAQWSRISQAERMYLATLNMRKEVDAHDKALESLANYQAQLQLLQGQMADAQERLNKLEPAQGE